MITTFDVQRADECGLHIAVFNYRSRFPLLQLSMVDDAGCPCFGVGAVYRFTPKGLRLVDSWPEPDSTVPSTFPKAIDSEQALVKLLPRLRIDMEALGEAS